MRKLIVICLAIGMLSVMGFAGERMAKGMIDRGAYPSNLMIEAIDSSCALVYGKIASAIDTVSEFQFRPVGFVPTWSATTRDSGYYAIFGCPVGMTATVRAISACKHSVVAANGDSAICWLRLYDASTDTLHHIVDIKFDSAAVGTDELLAITADSTAFLSMAAGDVIWAVTWGDTTAAVEALKGALIELDVDFAE